MNKPKCFKEYKVQPKINGHFDLSKKPVKTGKCEGEFFCRDCFGDGKTQSVTDKCLKCEYLYSDN